MGGAESTAHLPCRSLSTKIHPQNPHPIPTETHRYCSDGRWSCTTRSRKNSCAQASGVFKGEGGDACEHYNDRRKTFKQHGFSRFCNHTALKLACAWWKTAH